MTFRPEESHEDYIIRTLVVHAVTALIIGKSNKATKIFSDILLQPEIFKVVVVIVVTFLFYTYIIIFRHTHYQQCIQLEQAMFSIS